MTSIGLSSGCRCYFNMRKLKLSHSRPLACATVPVVLQVALLFHLFFYIFICFDLIISSEFSSFLFFVQKRVGEVTWKRVGVYKCECVCLCVVLRWTGHLSMVSPAFASSWPLWPIALEGAGIGLDSGESCRETTVFRWGSRLLLYNKTLWS